MARRVKIASVQFNLMDMYGKSGARAAVLAELGRNFKALHGHGLDLVIFSEGVEAVGQTVEQAERLDQPGPILQAYHQFADSENCTVAGSVKLTDGVDVFNSIVYVGSGRVLGVYRKSYLTHPELVCLTPGSNAVVVDTPAGRLGGVICFDLNFTELAEQYAALRPDILTFASMYHGGLMQGWWAYRCRAYFASALPFFGGGILNPFGEPLATTDCYSPIAMTTVNLDRVMVHLDHNREKFPDIRRKYLGKVDLHVPPNIGSALITSQCDEVSAMDVAREFELELLDDYLARARRDNQMARGGSLQDISAARID